MSVEEDAGRPGPRRMPRLRRILGEPLVHFFGVGALVFAADAWLGATAEREDRRIAISRAEVEGLAAMWSRGWGRPPGERELQALIDARIREEVLAREAARLGLDRDDVVVRRRLAQKMEFVLEGAADAEPSEEALQTFFDERVERYAEPARVDFRQVFFSRERRADPEGDARAALAALRRGRPGAGGAGDPIPLEPRHADLTDADVAALFGVDFASALAALDPGSWEGPVESAYGIHLVRVEGRRVEAPVRLADVRERVVSDWKNERREAVERAAFERLREGYDIAVELPEPKRLAAAGGAGK